MPEGAMSHLFKEDLPFKTPKPLQCRPGPDTFQTSLHREKWKGED